VLLNVAQICTISTQSRTLAVGCITIKQSVTLLYIATFKTDNTRLYNID